MGHFSARASFILATLGPLLPLLTFGAEPQREAAEPVLTIQAGKVGFAYPAT